MTDETASKGAKTESAEKNDVKSSVKEKKQVEVNQGGIWWNRRDLLNFTGWMAIFGFLGTMIAGTLRFMIPRVLFEPPTIFRAGFPTDYSVGEVSEKYKKEHRAWIVRNKEGFYALYAVCTHLGCTPRWLNSENKFKCPCHGSGFYREGINFEGPAPRPLDRCKIILSEDGQILVDTAVRFQEEKGQWSNPDAFLIV